MELFLTCDSSRDCAILTDQRHIISLFCATASWGWCNDRLVHSTKKPLSFFFSNAIQNSTLSADRLCYSSKQLISVNQSCFCVTSQYQNFVQQEALAYTRTSHQSGNHGKSGLMCSVFGYFQPFPNCSFSPMQNGPSITNLLMNGN